MRAKRGNSVLKVIAKRFYGEIKKCIYGDSMKETRIIAIVNQKGGVAKTTSAVNLGASLAVLQHKVLVIDLDPQGNASTALGIDQGDRVNTIYDVLISDLPIEQSISETITPNLSVIPSNINLSAAEIELLSCNDKEFVLKNAIDKIAGNYEYILIDCPPSLGQLTINALSAAKDVLIPMQCEFYALEGLSHLLKTVELIQANLNNDLKIFGVLLTMYDKRNKLTVQVEDDVRGCLGDVVFETIIPRNVRLSEAPSHNLSVIEYDITSIGAKAYLTLAREVLRRSAKVFA